MTAALRIAVADDERRMREYYQDILPRLGHTVVCAAHTGHELIELCSVYGPDLVITDIKMPDMDGIDAARMLCHDEPIPVILVSAYHDRELLQRASEEQILAYLVKPIKQADLEAAITITMQRFEQFRALRHESGELRRALEDRKVIERAKGILMKRTGLDEEQAFRRLRKMARDQNLKLAEAAQRVIQANDAFPST
jgi:response regulator NasT